jgi:hypothetical protein
MTMHPIRLLVPVTLAAALVGGCSGSERQDGGVSSGHRQEIAVASSGGIAVPVQAGAVLADFPTCDEVKATLGLAVDGLVELGRRGTGVTLGVDGPWLDCSWRTRGAADSAVEAPRRVAISVRISRDPENADDGMGSSGSTVQDERVASVGARAVEVDGSYDPDDRLDASGVRLVRDGVVVALTSSGTTLQDVPQLAPLTNRWALGRGVALLKLMDP